MWVLILTIQCQTTQIYYVTTVSIRIVICFMWKFKIKFNEIVTKQQNPWCYHFESFFSPWLLALPASQWLEYQRNLLGNDVITKVCFIGVKDYIWNKKVCSWTQMRLVKDFVLQLADFTRFHFLAQKLTCYCCCYINMKSQSFKIIQWNSRKTFYFDDFWIFPC